MLANKQDSPHSLSVDEIRNDYEEWYRSKQDAARRRYGDEIELEHRRDRMASLDVMGISALEGQVCSTRDASIMVTLAAGLVCEQLLTGSSYECRTIGEGRYHSHMDFARAGTL